MTRERACLLLAGCLVAVLLPSTVAVGQVGEWWNQDWGYCLDFSVTHEEIEGEAITVYVDFAHLMSGAGIKGELDRNSVRVLQMDAHLNPVAELPSVFEERLGQDAGWGYVTWLKGNHTHYQIYFDTLANGPKQPPKHVLSVALSKGRINMVRNPGFELDRNGDGLPDHWSFAGQDLAKKKWLRGQATRFVFHQSGKYAHSGKKSIAFALGKSVGKWQDFSVGHGINRKVEPLRGMRLNFRGYVYVESGAGVPRVRVRQFGKDGWITEMKARPPEETPGRWLKMTGSKVLKKRATSFNIQLSERIGNRDASFHYDDFNLQAEYPAPAQVSLDKKQYFLADTKAFVTVRFNVGTQVLRPLRATLTAAQGDAGLVTIRVKSKLAEEQIKGKTLRLSVEQDGKALLKREFPVAKEMKCALNIGKLKEGRYALKATVADDIGQTLFQTTRAFSRIKGPFDF